MTTAGPPEESADPPLKVDIGVRAEAKLEVKTEIPAQSSGRLLDALTDLIRPFSEARGLRADHLRLQREEVAIEIAQRARRRIEIEQGRAEPVPPKILVPLIERGSCEEIEDEEMIERWSDLLASASLKLNVHPRFVGILSEMARDQAQCLEYIAFNNVDYSVFPHRDFIDSSLNFAGHFVAEELRDEILVNFKQEGDIEAVSQEVIAFFSRPGAYLELIFIHIGDGDNMHCPYDVVEETGARRDEDLYILESLGLVRRIALTFDVKLKRPRGKLAATKIHYAYITGLGVAFCEVCCRRKICELAEIDKRNRAAMDAVDEARDGPLSGADLA